jgi:hypothetical protein
MNIKFRIILEDGTFIDSHDEMWNQVKDHCHALPPDNMKKWRAYEIWSDDFGLMIGVDFETGIFNIRGTLIHPANEQGESLTFLEEKQNFPGNPKDHSRDLLNGMNYYPVFGRKMIKGDWGESQIIFCGWKKKIGDRTIEKNSFLYPNGQISLS